MMPYQRLTKKVGDRYMYIHAGLGQEGLNRLGEFEDREELRIELQSIRAEIVKQEKEKKEGNK